MSWSYANIDWNGTGAMVQAIGSVAAILVSSAFAIGVPLYVRRLERREAANRSVLKLKNAAILLRSLIQTLLHRELETGVLSFVSAVEGHSRRLSAILDGVDMDTLGPEGSSVFATLEPTAAVVIDVVKEFCKGPPPYRVPTEVLEVLLNQIDERLASLDDLVVHNHQGSWISVRRDVALRLKRGGGPPAVGE